MITKDYLTSRRQAMKKIQDITLNAVQQSAECGQTQQGSEDREKIIDLWVVMSALFTNQWTSTNGEEVDETRVWQASLKGISESQIRKALDILVKQNPEWPPKPAAFREMCLYGNDSQEQAAFYKQAEKRPDRLLTKQKASKESVKAHLAEARAKLNKG